MSLPLPCATMRDGTITLSAPAARNSLGVDTKVNRVHLALPDCS